MKSLPNKEHTFVLDLKGAEVEYKGAKFTYKRPNIRTMSDIAKTEARLNENLPQLDPDIKFLHHVLATLTHTLIEAPEWWKEADNGFELDDLPIIFTVFNECKKYENEYVKKAYGEKKSEPKAEGAEQQPEAESDSEQA